eukprot:1377273-Rhodomonas_salina.1
MSSFCTDFMREMSVSLTEIANSPVSGSRAEKNCSRCTTPLCTCCLTRSSSKILPCPPLQTLSIFWYASSHSSLLAHSHDSNTSWSAMLSLASAIE